MAWHSMQGTCKKGYTGAATATCEVRGAGEGNGNWQVAAECTAIPDDETTEPAAAESGGGNSTPLIAAVGIILLSAAALVWFMRQRASRKGHSKTAPQLVVDGAAWKGRQLLLGLSGQSSQRWDLSTFEEVYRIDEPAGARHQGPRVL